MLHAHDGNAANRQELRPARTASLLAALAVLAACLLLALQLPSPAHAASKATWSSKGGYCYCKVDGKKLTGLKKVGGKTYYFDKKGRQLTGWRKVGSKYRFFRIANKAKGSMVANKVVNGIKLQGDGTAAYGSTGYAELKVMVKASKFVDAYTKPTQSTATKLKKCFSHLVYSSGLTVYHGWTSRSGWHRMFANDIFDHDRGDCNSYGAAYAYIANACGAKKAYAVASGGHGWSEVNGKVCDGQWAHGGRWRYYMFPLSQSGVGGAPAYSSNRAYIVKIAPRTKAWDKKVDKKTVAKTGLVKTKAGNIYYYRSGTKLTNAWKTVKGKRYWFTGSGKAAVKPTKIKRTSNGKKYYYVFNAKGVLQRGAKTRTVKVGGKTYRVYKTGRAASGWERNSAGEKLRYYLPTGQLACGVHLVNGKLRAFSAAGAYKADKSSKLNKAVCPIVNGTLPAKDASALLKLLGTPKKKTFANSCFFVYDAESNEASGGKDGTYTFSHITVLTYKTPKQDGGAEYLMDLREN